MKKNSSSEMKNVVLYGIGGIGEDIAYNLFYMFFIFFLTSVAGIKPAAAGTISLIAVMWDAVSDPIIGYLSDRCKGWKDFGKRGTFILFGAIPLGLSVFLLYNDVPLSGTGKVAFFILVNIAFWMFFTMVDIPYVAMATEITENYDVKTKMRTSVLLFSNLGQMVLSFGLLQFVDYMAGSGYADAFIWRIVGAAMGLISTVTFMCVAVAMRGKELKQPEAAESGEKLPDSHNKGELMQALKGLLKMHDYRILIIIGLVYNLYLGIANSSLLYYSLYSCGLTMAQSSVAQSVSLLISLFLITPVGELIVKFGKREVMMWSFVLMVISSLVCWLTAPSLVVFAVVNVILNVTSSVFWIDIYAMNFDVSALYEFKTGKNCEGFMVSICAFMTKVGVAVGMWLNGILMTLFNVDPTSEVITEDMVGGMQKIFGLIPAVISGVLVVACFLYRIKKEHILALEEASELKKAGKPYSTEGFEKLL